MVSVSYAILACNEHEEMNILLQKLVPKLKEQDEVVVLLDNTNEIPQKLYDVLDEYKDNIRVDWNALDKDFSQQKNELNRLCNGDYIFNIDADEVPSDYLLENIHQILEENDIDLFWLPRVNIVQGLTDEHIQKWGWNHRPMEQFILEKEIDTDDPEYYFLKNNDYIIDEEDV